MMLVPRIPNFNWEESDKPTLSCQASGPLRDGDWQALKDQVRLRRRESLKRSQNRGAETVK